MRLQTGNKVHVVLGENFQQGIVGLAEFGIILQRKRERREASCLACNHQLLSAAPTQPTH